MKKKLLKKATGMLVCSCLILGLAFPAMNVMGKTVEGIIKNVTIKNEHGVEPESMMEWDYICVHMDWEIPDNYVNSGDEMTIQLPPELRFVEDMEFDILDADGNLVARAVCNAENGTAKITFTEYPEKHSGVHGTFWFATMIERSAVNDGDIVRPEFTIEGEVLVGNEFEFVGEKVNEEELLNKYGIIGTDKSKIEYNIRIGMANKEVKGVAVTDRLLDEVVSYDKASFRVYEAQWKVGESGSWVSEELHLVSSIQPIFDADDRGFKMEFGDIAAHEGYFVQYTVNIGYQALPGEIFSNKATLSSEGKQVDESTAYTTYQTGGGTGTGYVGKIVLTKKGEGGELLADAHFDVIRISTGKSVGEIVTDSKGVGTIGDLLADEYKIIETKAPSGYKLDETPIIIDKDDWGEEKIIHLEVKNVLDVTPMPSATPTPEPSATPTPEPSATPTPEPSATPTPEPSATPTPNPSATPKPEPEPSATPTPSPSETPKPTPNPSETPTPTPEPSPSETPTPIPSKTPTPAPSETPKPESEPSETPTPAPSEIPKLESSEASSPTPTPGKTIAPSPKGKSGTPNTGANATGLSGPKTGDENNITPFVIMLMLSLIGIVYGVRGRRKYRKNKK